MNDAIREFVLRTTGSRAILKSESVQSLWSGYGEILRLHLDDHRTVILKHVRFPEQARHPRGWNSERSHLRKLRSYEVECAWYRTYAERCRTRCPLPRCLALEQRDDEVLMLLEDLDASGFPGRRESATLDEMVACLRWLANLHARFLGERPEGLWEQGTYWHLATRPDELAALEDEPLREAAAAIDAVLDRSPYRTFVHGDAKLANFCFSVDGSKVAAVDFQYAGGGCGMKDVAYFIGSCLDEHECEQHEAALLDAYFRELRSALSRLRPEMDADPLESDWRALFPVAWTDFHRFLKGWSPGHWKIHDYSEKLARQVVARLVSGGN